MEHSEFSVQVIADLLFRRTGQSLGKNRRWRIGTALAGLTREHGFSSIDQLVVQLTRPGQAGLEQQVVEALLNNETYFFRDRAMFQHLERQVLPQVARNREATRKISIWSAGCSTGQEVLSLAMIFAADPTRWDGWNIDILGTDVSGAVIDAARVGRYAHFEVQRGLGVMEMLNNFDETQDGWRVKSDLLRRVRFERHNLLDGPPTSCRFDLVLCRNVLLYFEGETRRKGVSQLTAALADDGVLMVGGGETLVSLTDLVVPSPDISGVYRRPPAARAA
ncbi:CheR family methyltransferase [Tsuneonella mangrovi]|uniref:CheR family methyltransferase n=1 Tax=Tsuneonella mangrovi TaxID=1982042 RepID=UPI000BA2BB55|nr:protein-glutamate O-methyltransferase CheR [Tsuneonella mangrovi]